MDMIVKNNEVITKQITEFLITSHSLKESLEDSEQDRKDIWRHIEKQTAKIENNEKDLTELKVLQKINHGDQK